MAIELEAYGPTVGEQTLSELRFLAKRLRRRRVQHINSTAVGGGVAEILHRMVPLLNQLGVETRWDVIKGGQRFFEVTKKFHNVLHGQAAPVTLDDFEEFLETSRANAAELALTGDILVVHDPQPIALVTRKRRQDRRWIWRCHIDVSNPNERVWR
ncbi:MAG: glycosyl transferase family 1, partial [Candidatus Omnitrophica bacterium]|nr:glycosyl transferase family 1 [Candidatus Omnitrophota bacterium]